MDERGVWKPRGAAEARVLAEAAWWMAGSGIQGEAAAGGRTRRPGCGVMLRMSSSPTAAVGSTPSGTGGGRRRWGRGKGGKRLTEIE